MRVFASVGIAIALAACGDVLVAPDAPIDAALPITVTVMPPTASVDVLGTVAFTAQAENGKNGVMWSVNGVAGGDATVGMIAANGMYTAPKRRPHPITVTITATSADDPTKTATAMATITAKGVLFAAQTSSRIDIFETVLTRNGNVAPNRSLFGNLTQLSYNIGAAIDPVHDRLYFANYSGPTVTAYDGIDSANGNLAPVAKLISNPAFQQLENVDVDPTKNLLYVSGQLQDIKVFDMTQSLDGTIAPIRTFHDAAAATSSDKRTFLDVANDRMYQTDTNGGKVFVFDNASTLDGTVTATRTLTGATTTLQCPWGVAWDSKRDILYVSDYCTNNIKVFAAGSTVTGDVAPTHILTVTGASSYEDLQVDPDTDRLAMQCEGPSAVYFLDNVSTLDAAQTAPRSITGAATQMTNVQGLFVDWDR